MLGRKRVCGRLGLAPRAVGPHLAHATLKFLSILLQLQFPTRANSTAQPIPAGHNELRPAVFATYASTLLLSLLEGGTD